MTKTLLQKATEVKPAIYNIRYTTEELELIEAWLVGDVSLTQVQRATGKASTSTTYAFLAVGARQIFQKFTK